MNGLTNFRAALNLCLAPDLPIVLVCGAILVRSRAGDSCASRLYLDCTRFRQFQQQQRQEHHAKSVTCMLSISLRSSNPTLSVQIPNYLAVKLLTSCRN
jgi:hypothetical protein